MSFPDWVTQQQLPTEETFDRFVKNFGGKKISDFLPGNPSFQNADYLFQDDGVIAELKTLKKDFGTTDDFRNKYFELTKKYILDGRISFGAIFRPEERPQEFFSEFIRLFRPPISRILKKANSQLKETKKALNLPNAVGIMVLANDDFVSLEPQFITALISEILVHSYSSIDAFVYLTLNHYVDIPDNNYANLLWIPAYSQKAPNWLQDFINRVGNEWFNFLEAEIGPFDNKLKTNDFTTIARAKVIR